MPSPWSHWSATVNWLPNVSGSSDSTGTARNAVYENDGRGVFIAATPAWLPDDGDDTEALASIRGEVAALCAKFPAY